MKYTLVRGTQTRLQSRCIAKKLRNSSLLSGLRSQRKHCCRRLQPARCGLRSVTAAGAAVLNRKETKMTNMQTKSSAAAVPKQNTKSTRVKATRTETLLNLLRSKRGATIEQLQQADAHPRKEEGRTLPLLRLETDRRQGTRSCITLMPAGASAPVTSTRSWKTSCCRSCVTMAS